jgi:Holliday junction resolvasome RuvABC endonuclease subunit
MLNEIPQDIQLKESNLLFLDISSSCTGYSIFQVNFETKKAVLRSCGAIWLPDVSHQKKYAYLYNAITVYFNIIEKVDFIVAESYAINKDRMMGVMVTPEAHGACKAAAEECGMSFITFTPQSWRKELGVKKTITGDYKQPCKEKVLEYVQIPEKLVSNITHNERQTPSDIYDAIGLGIGFLKRLINPVFICSGTKIQGHVGVLDVET